MKQREKESEGEKNIQNTNEMKMKTIFFCLFMSFLCGFNFKYSGQSVLLPMFDRLMQFRWDTIDST